MCRKYKLACPNWCCLLLPCFNGELNLVCWWKMLILSALIKQHGGIKSSISWSKNSTISQAVCSGALSCWKIRIQATHTSAWNWSSWAFFVAAMVKLPTVCYQWTRWSPPSFEWMKHCVYLVCNIYDSFAFYAWKQLLLSVRLSHRNSVCPSVSPSHGWISQKWCKLGSPNLYRRLPGRL